MSSNVSPFGVSFVSLPGATTIQVIDPIERHRFQLDTERDIQLTTDDPEPFLFPVDAAVRATTDRIVLPYVVATYVRSQEGELIAEAEHDTELSLPPAAYIIEICGPIKIYLEVDAGFTIEAGANEMAFSFDAPVDLAIGARSAHERPEGTLVTTEDPEDMMAVISAFGSALKTTSPERTFPTLRGHPPTVELGDTLSVPDGLQSPDTGITIEVRPELSQVFEVAPLVYFLGATVRPGDTPRLLIDEDFEHPLENAESLATNVERALKQTFLLDCVTRTEGLYKVDLAERESLEPILGFDFTDLYEESLARRVETYLDVPYPLIEDAVPEWGVSAHMLPNPSAIEVIPYLVDDLALIKVHQASAIERPTVSTSIAGAKSRGGDAFVRSSSDTVSPPADFVKPPLADSVEQVWVGEGTPIGASKAIPAAFENRLERAPSTTNIDITVICNDTAMNEEENLIYEFYGSREDVEFDLSVHDGLTRDELTDVLANRTDFLHYIGHIDDEGFECRDGKLDISAVDTIGVSAFLLNACQSYRQGRHLIEGGAIGGIVTLSEVINAGAVRMGANLARLLNRGFPLYAALDIAKTESLMGPRYIVVGDGRVALTQPQSVPYLCEVDRSNGIFDFEYMTYPTSRIDLGSMTIPYITSYDKHMLVSQRISDINPTRAELLEFLRLEDHMPVRLDGELEWSHEIDSV